MTGSSLLPLVQGRQAARRDRVFLERERHANVRKNDSSYPVRAVRTRDFLYIRNLRPDRWPAGDPEVYFSVGPFGDIDGGPTKSLLLERRTDPAIEKFFELATAKRSAEELYDLRKDPAEVRNLAADPAHREVLERMRAEMAKFRSETHDPWLPGQATVFGHEEEH